MTSSRSTCIRGCADCSKARALGMLTTGVRGDDGRMAVLEVPSALTSPEFAITQPRLRFRRLIHHTALLPRRDDRKYLHQLRLVVLHRSPHRVTLAGDYVVGMICGIEQRPLPIGMLGFGDDMAQRNAGHVQRSGMFGFIHQQRRTSAAARQEVGQALFQRRSARAELTCASRKVIGDSR